MGKRWRDASVDGDTDTARPIVPVRKVRRRVNYEEWRERESACVYIYTIGRTRAVNLVIKGPFCYRFNRIMLSRTDRKFGGMATHVGHRPPEISRSVRRCRVSSPLLSSRADRRPPYLRHSPSAAHRPPQTIFTRGHHLAACEIHLGKCSLYIHIYIYMCVSRSFRSWRDRTHCLGASTGLNHKIVPERRRNSTDLREWAALARTLAARYPLRFHPPLPS